MANYLKMSKSQQVAALVALGWSFRRIQRETGVDRGTVAKYAQELRSKPAKVFPGSAAGETSESSGFGSTEGSKPAKVTAGSWPEPAKVFPGSRSAAAAFRSEIQAGIDARLTAQRIYQDLVEEHGYGHSYESVKRFVRQLAPERKAVGVMHSDPGEEAQVDFFQGAPTLDPERGQWRRPWVFRMTLCCSRHGYEEAVWDQKLPTFLRLHENAFGFFGGVPKVIRHDNLKAAVVRACLYDPDVNPVYEAFGKHWGFVGLPTRPRNPKESGKQERAGGYVKSNALKGRRFDSLEEKNAFLRRWNRTVASLRIHGTTRRQVIRHFEEVEKVALQPLAETHFTLFERGTRKVHPDGHVEVAGSFYPVSAHLMGEDLEVRWDQRLVRVYRASELIAVHRRVRPGHFAPSPGQPEGMSSSQKAYTAHLLGRCAKVGDDLEQWAQAAVAERSARSLRLIQGALSLLRSHPKETVLWAAKMALEHRLFRYRDLARLTDKAAARLAAPKPLLATNEHIRPLDQYSLEVL